MRIAQLAPNVESVPAKGYGGTELVVSLITEELVRRGHEVTLFASGDSQTKARLVSVTETSLRTNEKILPTQWSSFDLQIILKLRDLQDEFDIVHNHLGYQALSFLDQLPCATVTTNHNLVKPYNAPLYLRYKHLPYVAISNAYKRLNYPDEMNYAAVVYNGIDLKQFPTNPDQSNRDYLLFVGRVCKDKGTRDAIEVAKRLKRKLLIAGKVDRADRAYFEKEVEPELDGKLIEYIGEVNHEQKVALYQKAIAVVYPIAFEEPFGLVMAESLACGTPLLAFDRGSVREVLTDGETAIIGNTVDDLVNGFAKLKTCSPHKCRQRVVENFSVKRMVDNYESLYERLVGEKDATMRRDMGALLDGVTSSR